MKLKGNKELHLRCAFTFCFLPYALTVHRSAQERFSAGNLARGSHHFRARWGAVGPAYWSPSSPIAASIAWVAKYRHRSSGGTWIGCAAPLEYVARYGWVSGARPPIWPRRSRRAGTRRTQAFLVCLRVPVCIRKRSDRARWHHQSSISLIATSISHFIFRGSMVGSVR